MNPNQNKKTPILALAAALLTTLVGFYIHHTSKQQPRTPDNVTLSENKPLEINPLNTPHVLKVPLPEEATLQRDPAAASAPAATEPSATTQAQPQAQVQPAQPQGCFQVSFTHKKLSSHADGEACMHHSNLLTLNDLPINPASICVEVNGEAVRHRSVPSHPNQLSIGPEAGPNATITVRYCTGKLVCQKKCNPTGDGFLGALGAIDQNTDQTGWDGSKKMTAHEMELEKEAKGFSQMAGADGESTRGEFFTGWVAQEARGANCTKGGDHDHTKGMQVSKSSSGE